MCAAGNPPDMMFSDAYRAGDLQRMGYLQPIEKWAKDWPELKHFYPYLLKQLSWDGKLYGLPTLNEISFLGGHIRPQIIKKFWGDPENIKTWEDWLSALKACHNQNYEGHKVYGVGWGSVDDNLAVIKWLGMNNGPVDLGDFLDPTKKKNWIEALDMYQKLWEYMIPGVESMTYKDVQRAYANNLIADYPMAGTWMYGNILPMAPKTCTPDQMGMLSGPIGPSHTLSHPLNRGSAYGLIMFKDIPEERKEAVWKFMSFHVSKKNAARFPGIMHAPPRDDVSIDDIIAYSQYKEPEKYRWYVIECLKMAENSVQDYKVVASREVRDALKVIGLDLGHKKITSEEAYSRIYKKLFEIWSDVVCQD